MSMHPDYKDWETRTEQEIKAALRTAHARQRDLHRSTTRAFLIAAGFLAGLLLMLLVMAASADPQSTTLQTVPTTNTSQEAATNTGPVCHQTAEDDPLPQACRLAFQEANTTHFDYHSGAWWITTDTRYPTGEELMR